MPRVMNLALAVVLLLLVAPVVTEWDGKRGYVQVFFVLFGVPVLLLVLGLPELRRAARVAGPGRTASTPLGDCHPLVTADRPRSVRSGRNVPGANGGSDMEQRDRDHELLSRFWSLHAAIIRRDGIEERMRSGPVDTALLDRSLMAAEAVLDARTSLYRHLMASGWTPPDVLVKDLAYDEVVLEQADGLRWG